MSVEQSSAATKVGITDVEYGERGMAWRAAAQLARRRKRGREGEGTGRRSEAAGATPTRKNVPRQLQPAPSRRSVGKAAAPSDDLQLPGLVVEARPEPRRPGCGRTEG